VYESRAEDNVGVRLLLRSVARYHPEWGVKVYLPNASREAVSACEAEGFACNDTFGDIGLTGWNAKADCLLRELYAGHPRVLWLDSDIVLASNTHCIFKDLDEDTLLAAVDPHCLNFQGSTLRTRGWGMEIGRSFPRTINTCVLSVTPSHARLVERWAELLRTPVYATAQENSWQSRPRHMMGDQDVFTALLGSVEFADVPVHLLRDGLDIAQCFEEDGYRAVHRLRNCFRGLPPLIHSQGSKPWRSRKKGMKQIALDLSPYSRVAQEIGADVPGVEIWSRPQTRIGRTLDLLTFGNPSLRGLPISLIMGVYRWIGRALKETLCYVTRGARCKPC
jgi:hypothetical protein